MVKINGKPGAPTKYREKYVTEVVRLAEEHRMSLLRIAASWSVTRETVYEWRRQHPEFDEACKIARTKYCAALENRIDRGMDNPKFNAHAAQMMVLHFARFEAVSPIKMDMKNIQKSLKAVMERKGQTADQKLRQVQAIETAVRAHETSDAIAQIEEIKEQLEMKNKTRVRSS